MAINGQNVAAIKALVTGATTTEADFRTGTDHIIDQVESSAGASVKTEQFNTGSGNYVVPDGVTKLMVHGAGAGGGGGGASNTNGGGPAGTGAGAGGQVFFRQLTVTSGSTIAYSIGSGGSGGTGDWNTGNSGSAGNATTFGSINLAGGGGGGGANSTSAGGNVGSAGAGGAVSGGTGNFAWTFGGSGVTGGDGYVPWSDTLQMGKGGNASNQRGSNAETGQAGFLLIQVGG